MARSSQFVTIENVLITTSIGLLTVLGIYWYQRKRKCDVPSKWKSVGKVKNLYIYPLKSGHRIELNTALCTEYGVLMPKSGKLHQLSDRSLVVYRESDHEFHTARQHPKMIFIKISPAEDNKFTLNAPDMPTITVNIPNSVENKKTEITLHKGEKIPTIDCGDNVASWLSQYILGQDSGMRLGFHDGSRRRDISQSHKKYLEVYPRLRNETTGKYSDLSSYNIINQASVTELSNRIPEACISAHNFRPNILIEGKNAPAFAEDDWEWIKIGDVVLYSARPCTRCILTTINPKTGVKSVAQEPLNTMRKYRRLKVIKNIDLDGQIPVIGVNMGLSKTGEISVGDTVYVGKI